MQQCQCHRVGPIEQHYEENYQSLFKEQRYLGHEEGGQEAEHDYPQKGEWSQQDPQRKFQHCIQ